MSYKVFYVTLSQISWTFWRRRNLWGWLLSGCHCRRRWCKRSLRNDQSTWGCLSHSTCIRNLAEVLFCEIIPQLRFTIGWHQMHRKSHIEEEHPQEYESLSCGTKCRFFPSRHGRCLHWNSSKHQCHDVESQIEVRCPLECLIPIILFEFILMKHGLISLKVVIDVHQPLSMHLVLRSGLILQPPSILLLLW